MFSCSIQLSMKFVLLLNLKLLLFVNVFLLNIAEYENFSADKYKLPTIKHEKIYPRGLILNGRFH